MVQFLELAPRDASLSFTRVGAGPHIKVMFLPKNCSKGKCLWRSVRVCRLIWNGADSRSDSVRADGRAGNKVGRYLKWLVLYCKFRDPKTLCAGIGRDALRELPTVVA